MTDQTTATPEAPASRALTIQRERLITHAPSAMFDSAAFEHLQRVATVLAHSGLVPKSLTHVKNGNDEVELPLAMVVARCTLLADQAQRAGADVIAYIQSTSIINGRLMHEGKLVNAVVRQRLGVHLRYRFGLWDTDHIEFPPLVPALDEGGEPLVVDGKPVMVPDSTFLHGAGERLACRIFDRDAPDDYVEGSVAQWKTTRSGSPWASQANWPRQLRYRGAREWARAYDPGAMLGMLADGDEDIDDLVTLTARPVGLMQRLRGEQSGDGFDAASVEEQTGGKRKRRTKAEMAADAALAAADVAAEPEEAMHAQEADAEPCEHEWDRAEAPDGEQVCVKCGVIEPIPQTSAAPADSAAETPASSPSPAPSDTSPKTQSNPTTTEAAGGATSASPSEHALPGEVYMLAGDGYNNYSRRLIYKDGARFSTVHKAAEGKYHTYPKHAPEAVAPDESDLPEHMRDGPATIEQAREQLERPTETGSAPDAEPEPDTSETATPASSDGAPQVEGSGQSPQADGEMPDDLAVFIEAVEAAPQWADVKKAMSAFYPTETFKAFPPEKQNKIRASTWEACVERKAAGELKDIPDHADDLSAFRLWLEAQGDPDAIKGTLYTLQRGDQWKAAPEPMKAAITAAVGVRLEGLK